MQAGYGGIGYDRLLCRTLQTHRINLTIEQVKNEIPLTLKPSSINHPKQMGDT
jgi:hypothetical protein